MRGTWTGVGLLALATLGTGSAGCSSMELPKGSGGNGGATLGAGGSALGIGGSGVGGNGVGGTGVGGTGIGGRGVGGTPGTGGTTGGSGGFMSSNGSCIDGHVNPDFTPGGACAPDCQSVSCGKPCTEDCCATCGIDQSGAKTCTCPNPGAPYINCSCLPPAYIPPGLVGGFCSPQGYSTPTVPLTAPSGSIALRGLPCKAVNLVCFTADSTATSERGCICLSDGVMHCGSVNHWFTNNGLPTAWMP